MIHIDFDQTLATVAALSDAYGRFIPMPPGNTVSEKFEKRRAEREKFDSLNRGEQIDFWREKGGVIVEDPRDGYTVVAFARPNAYNFLMACLEMDPTTSILTAGATRWQTRISRRLGFPNVELYGRDCYGEVPAHPHNLLVDDLWPSTTGVQEKMKALGFKHSVVDGNIVYPTERHVQVSPWNGYDACTELLQLIPTIKGMLPG